VPTAEDLRVEHAPRLSPKQTAAVRDVVLAAADRDRVNPLSEHVVLHLRYGGDTPVHNVLVWLGDRLAGYGHLDTTDAVEGASAELVVDPELRNRGVGTTLVEELLKETPDGRLRLWAHGQHPAAAALGRRMGFEQARVLWQMRRSLLAPLPPVELPDDVRLRTFVVGQDEAAWTAVNNRAFAGHPEQGRWGEHEVRLREQEPWFDPAGFFLSERDSDQGTELVGFHWTKVHGGHSHDAEGSHIEDHGHEPIGEVYVVGVDPSLQGVGLGRALTIAGLQYLRGRGLTQAMLYVDESNTGAIKVYESLGFAQWDKDVSYRRTPT
jgi:mycothiol synthase